MGILESRSTKMYRLRCQQHSTLFCRALFCLLHAWYSSGNITAVRPYLPSKVCMKYQQRQVACSYRIRHYCISNLKTFNVHYPILCVFRKSRCSLCALAPLKMLHKDNPCECAQSVTQMKLVAIVQKSGTVSMSGAHSWLVYWEVRMQNWRVQ